MVSMATLEDTQRVCGDFVKQCAELNEGLDRDEQFPFITVVDPLAGALSEETIKHINKEGHASRGFAGRGEALLWNPWLKKHNFDIANLPMVSVFVNHMKECQSANPAPGQVAKKVNPGGSAQNYAATYHLRLTKAKSKSLVSTSLTGISHEHIIIKSAKSSRSATGLATEVRKKSKKEPDGSTTFWWDWGYNTIDFLLSLPANHPVNDVIKVRGAVTNTVTCDYYAKKEEVDASEFGARINNDEALVDKIAEACMWRRLQEYDRLSVDEYGQLKEIAIGKHAEWKKANVKKV